MVNVAGINQLGDRVFVDLRVEVRNLQVETALYVHLLDGFKILGQQALDFRPYRIGGIFALFDPSHRNYAARINGIKGYVELAGNTTVMVTCNERRIIVGDNGCRGSSQLVEDIVWSIFCRAEMEDGADACTLP